MKGGAEVGGRPGSFASGPLTPGQGLREAGPLQVARNAQIGHWLSLKRRQEPLNRAARLTPGC